MFRRTPLTSTLAKDCSASTISTTWPGIPRHIVVLLSEVLQADSADPRKRVADEHVDDSAAAESCSQRDDAGWVGHDLADHGRALSQRMLAQGGNGRLGLIGRHDGDELAFVGH